MSADQLPLFVLNLLSAELLVFGTVYLAYTVAGRLLGPSTVARRWSASLVIGMWLATVVFHFLYSVGQFRLSVAILVVSLLVLIGRASGHHFRSFLGNLSRDLRWLSKQWRILQGSRHRWWVYLLALVTGLKAIRAALLPPLGWDSLTYHAVKAGMWVQEAGPPTFDAPGAWNSYRNYFGGGEIFTAWAMLPFHSDLLVSLVDVFQWLSLGIVLYALGRELGLRVRYAWIGAVYVIWLPALHLSIGSAYVEPVLNLALLGGLLFAIRFVKQLDSPSLLLTLMAMGVACGIKITAVPTALVLLAILCWPLIRGSNRSSNFRWLLYGSGAALLVTLPWLVYNIQQSGYPLSPIPVEIWGLTLGEPNATLHWSRHLLQVQPYTWDTEMDVWRCMVRSPLIPGVHLSALTLLPMGLCLPVLGQWLRRKQTLALVVLGFMGSILVFFYTPGFSLVRIVFAEYNGRFLFPMAAVAVLISLRRGRDSSLPSQLYAGFLTIGVVLHAYGGLLYGWAPFEKMAVPLALVILLVLLFFLADKTRSAVLPRLIVGTGLLAPLVILPVLVFYKDVTRYPAAKSSDLMHPTLKYWASGAELVDSVSQPQRIAVTSGPWQKADNWAIYFFMGKRLQNQLFYIPVSRTGEIMEFGPEGTRERSADFDAWLKRIIQRGITHIVSFHPTSVEMLWMEARPDLFDRLAGLPGFWGCYRVKE